MILPERKERSRSGWGGGSIRVVEMVPGNGHAYPIYPEHRTAYLTVIFTI